VSVTGRSAEACPQAPNGRALWGSHRSSGGLDAEASSIACPVSDQPCLVALIFLSVANVPSSFPPPSTGVEIAYPGLVYEAVDASVVSGLAFTRSLIDVGFDQVAVLRTSSGVFKLAPRGEGACTSDADCTVSFDWARIEP